MKNRVIFIAFLFVCHQLSSQNQLNSGILPDSYNKLNVLAIDNISIPKPSQKSINEIVERNEKDGSFYKIGELLPVNLTSKNSGTIENLENNRKIWRLKLSSEDAKASVIHFDYFKPQKGSSFFAYTPDYEYVFGPYTDTDNIDGLGYSIGLLPNDEVILEYSLPINAEFSENDFKIAAFSYIFRGVGDMFVNTKGYKASEACEINVNCSEGDNWRIQQRGVVRIYVVDSGAAGWCSGSLINNTSNDGTPYILTADHCGETSTESNFNQWKFYFNYESSGCVGTSGSGYKIFTGCTKIASAPLVRGSDFLLLKMKNVTLEQLKSTNAVFNGWNNANTASPSGVCIHHPAGDIKKISTYTNTLISSTYYGQGATNAHWKVTWAATANGRGVTEGGSSGSPIFNNNGYIVGTLSGGSSECNNPNWPDLYGKFSYHWSSNTINGTDDITKLKPWLDPTNSDVTTCNYYDPNAIVPVTDITDIPTSTMAGTSITLNGNVIPSNATNQTITWTITNQGTTAANISNNNILYTPQKGTVTITATIANGISNGVNYVKNNISIIVNENIEVKDNNISDLKIFPNPNNGKFTVDLGTLTANEIIISDITGKEIFRNAINSSIAEFDFGSNISGIYIVKIITTTDVFTKKITIE